jgi:hypothetical protein
MLWAATVGVKLGKLHGEAAAIFEGMVHDHKYSRDERPTILKCTRNLIKSEFLLMHQRN